MPSHIGRVIAKARARKGVSLQALAKEAKVHPSLISRLEQGKQTDVRLSIAARLCRALGLPLEQLVEGGRLAELPDRGPTIGDLTNLKKELGRVLQAVEDMVRRS